MTPQADAPSLDMDLLAATVRRRQCVPSSTYRVQFHAGFGFRDAAGLVPYLQRLGVGACYYSPFLQARPGSQHGYDICDHAVLHRDLGDEADYQVLVDALAEADLGQIIDFVPNHMGVDPVANRWWRDVLENGPASRYADYFDIDWEPIKVELRGKVLLPVLADQYGVVLERGELQLAWRDDRLVVAHGTQHFPIDPKQYLRVLQPRLSQLEARFSRDTANRLLFGALLQAFQDIPDCGEVERREQRYQLVGAALELLQVLMKQGAVAAHVQQNIEAFNGTPGEPASFDALHELLEAQPYRLAFWKTAHDEINYRRFFHIQELGGLRMEDPRVFADTHHKVLQLVRRGQVTGIRLDHIDGLYDPLAYLQRLQQAVLLQRAAETFGDAVLDAPTTVDAILRWRCQQPAGEHAAAIQRPLYVVAEKILSAGESLPEHWPLHGTSGYDFLNDLNRLFVRPDHAAELNEIYQRFTATTQPFEEVVERSKLMITRSALASELKMLARELNRISEKDRRMRDFTLDSLREAIREAVVAFPVYRTYIDGAGGWSAQAESGGGPRVGDEDRQLIERAVRRAIRRNPDMSPAVFALLRQVLLLEGPLARDEFERHLRFTMKLQQYTGPVEAKGVEDTAFYRHNVLLSLNEVGGSPLRFGGRVEDFHQANRQRHKAWPETMLATATHDTKRGEDVRARINVLSEIPQRWQRHVQRWSKLHQRHRSQLDGEAAPAAADEYALYQTLLGAWPADADPAGEVPQAFCQRISDFLVKAAKEASLHTGWMHPAEDYDKAVADFVQGVLRGETTAEFLSDFLPLQQELARAGMLNSLAQVVLKIVSPGVPDFYQGTELWDLSLVDPDNRRPVDFDRRRQLLDDLEPLLQGASSLADSQRQRWLSELLERWPDGRIKLLVTAAGLRLRRRDPQLFLGGDYLPLPAAGEAAEHLIAVARLATGRAAIAIAPRWVTSLGKSAQPWPLGRTTWGETTLPWPADRPGAVLCNLLTGQRITPQQVDGQQRIVIAEALQRLPVALLASE